MIRPHFVVPGLYCLPSPLFNSLVVALGAAMDAASVMDAGWKVLGEMGIVFFLFEMGLELSVSRLMAMKRDVFGMGLATFGVTAAVIAAAGKVVGLTGAQMLVIGGGMALSSSAFVLQLLRDRDDLGTRYGRACFGILLFQARPRWEWEDHGRFDRELVERGALQLYLEIGWRRATRTHRTQSPVLCGSYVVTCPRVVVARPSPPRVPAPFLRLTLVWISLLWAVVGPRGSAAAGGHPAACRRRRGRRGRADLGCHQGRHRPRTHRVHR